MNFLNPNGFWLLLLLAPIVLLYLLKLRRDDHPVSSTFLWQTFIRDRQANAPWQRLQRNLLMVLQMLFIAALVMAVVRPFIWREGISNDALILIFDQSLSMSATDEQPNRLGEARRRALEILDNLPDETLVTVIAAGSRPRTLLSLSRDKTLIRQSINSIQATAQVENLAPALQIASAISDRQPNPHTIIFSDRWDTLPERLALKGSYSFDQVGSKPDNQSIQALTYEPQPDGKNLNVFIKVSNSGVSESSRRLILAADGVTVHAADIQIPAHSDTTLVVNRISSSSQMIEAHLQPAFEGQDYLPADDAAFAVIRQPSPVKIALVGPGDYFLETALRLMPGLEISKFTADEFSGEDFALVIYDRSLPESGTAFPASNLLIISPAQSTEFFDVTGTVELPIPQIIDPADPLVAGLELSGTSILDAAQISTPGWANPLVIDAVSTVAPVPLLFAGETAGRRIAVLAFSINRSDLPLNVAFPIMISRLVRWLAPGSVGLVPTALAPGEILLLDDFLLTLPGSVNRLSVIKPDGSAEMLNTQQTPIVFAGTDQPGVYHIELDGSAAISFAVNSFSASESDITPSAPPAELLTEGGQNSAASQLAPHEGWRWAAVLALIILMIEWLLYHRVTLSRLLSMLHSRLGASELKSR